MFLYYFRFANPIYGDGDYPAIMRRMVNKKNRELNITDPRLPYFTDSEKKMVKGVCSSLKSLIAGIRMQLYVLVFIIW